ncbi:MAG: HAD-IIIC family phosphatase [Terriglobia bacterium]
MYETEANNIVESLEQLPAEAVREFRDFREKVVARTVLPWGEHCTECVWPTCYTTCDLYSPREDGKCRRFVQGMVRVDCPGAVNSYLLKIRFKRWGKLWSPGNVRLFALDEADQQERSDRRIGSTLQHLPLPASLRAFATSKRYVWKKRVTNARKPSPAQPDFFVVECFNPGEQTVNLSLTLRSANGARAVPFQRLIPVAPGFHREEIPASEISMSFNLQSPFSVELIPNDIADGATFFFGLLDFVQCKPRPKADSKEGKALVKCIVWDLDNTMWDGILVEDGPEKLRLKPGIAEIIKSLDRRGILHSIASKNNFDEAMAVLKSHQLDQYFLHPQISWGPKSEAVKAIAQRLNIGIDTLMLVDDSDFELAEVHAACPTAMVLQADKYLEIPELPACQGSETAEGPSRRKMYQQEAVRETAVAGFAGDYFAFLRDCKIEMEIERLSAANLQRVHELTQRTNQMNFSGKRYERKLLEEIAATKHLDTYVISCRDRFGSYGIVGFSIVDAREPRMTDLMFSCRIQAKRVEHAFLAFLLKKYISGEGSDFRANYRKTPRNAPSGQVFQDIGMEERGDNAGVTSLVFPRGRPIPDDRIISIVEK